MKTMRFLTILRNALIGILSAFTVTTASASTPTASKICLNAEGVDLITDFFPTTNAYTVRVAESTNAALSVVPSTADALVDVTDGKSTYSNHSLIALNPGSTLTVTLTDSGQSTDYIIMVESSQPTVYLTNTGGWSTPCVWAWNEESVCTANTEWPGDPMTLRADGLYSWSAPKGLTPAKVVFSNNGSPQTPDCLFVDGGLYDCDGILIDNSPQAPVISLLPSGGRLTGDTRVVIRTTGEPDAVTAAFDGVDIPIESLPASFILGDYLADGQTGVLQVTAQNAVGPADGRYVFTRDDTLDLTPTTDMRGLSIYEIMTCAFMHGTNTGPGFTDFWGPANHRKDGNLKGITESLDYIKDLGMNAIWMTPIFDTRNGLGGEKLQATGYFATDYFTIDPRFGTDEDFDELIAEAHKRGIYIFLDGVFGHHGGVDKPSPEGNEIDTRDEVPNDSGAESANVAYPGSLEYYKEVLRYWTERGVDGWRLDACFQVSQNDHNYWHELKEELESIAAQRAARGEKWGTLAYMVGEDWYRVTTRQDGLRSLIDFHGREDIINADAARAVSFLMKTPQDRGYEAGVEPATYVSSHDVPRAISFVGTFEAMKQRHAILAAHNGPSIVLYNDEIATPNGAGGNWDNMGRVSGRIDNFNAAEQDLHDYVAAIFRARVENPALWRGDMSVSALNGGATQVLTKTDALTGNRVIVIFSDVDAQVPLSVTGIDLITNLPAGPTVPVTANIPVFIRVN